MPFANIGGCAFETSALRDMEQRSFRTSLRKTPSGSLVLPSSVGSAELPPGSRSRSRTGIGEWRPTVEVARHITCRYLDL